MLPFFEIFENAKTKIVDLKSTRIAKISKNKLSSELDQDEKIIADNLNPSEIDKSSNINNNKKNTFIKAGQPSSQTLEFLRAKRKTNKLNSTSVVVLENKKPVNEVIFSEDLDIKNSCSVLINGVKSINISSDKLNNQDDTKLLKIVSKSDLQSCFSTNCSLDWISDCSQSFILYAVIIHSGSSFNGHYYLYCKDYKSSKWIKFNDEIISIVPYSEVVKKGLTDSYQFFYVRKNIWESWKSEVESLNNKNIE